MLAVADALQIVLTHCPAPSAVEATLAPALLGQVLAESVVSDMDLPPFDKSLMDGFAVRAAEIADGVVRPIAAEVMAGQTPPPLPAHHAIRIMTGAPIPDGADAIIPIERTEPIGTSAVRFRTSTKAGQFILRRAAEMKQGDVVLTAGTVLTPQVLGLLASVGRTSAHVVPPPRVAVLATGDELVPADQRPGPGQLRNSNGPMLLAQATRAGAAVRSLGIAPDDRDRLTAMIRDALRSSVVILSGGVSVGQRDLVPIVLRELGVEAHVHQVAMRPGKPFFFGTRGETLVFGLPGNPVSSFCCFELFVRPAMRKLSGHTDPGPRWREASLAEEFAHQSDRPTYHPARLIPRGDRLDVQLIPWLGSPDLRAMAGADALALLPAGSNRFPAGERLPVLTLS